MPRKGCEQNRRRYSLAKKLIGYLAASFMLSSTCLLAAENDRAEEKFTLAVGAYDVLNYNSGALLTTREVGVGLAFSPEDVLGLDSRQTVLRLEGAWHIRPSHALTFSSYKINSTNSLNVEKDFDWIDKAGSLIVIPIGARVGSRLDYEILKLGYLWSFYDSDKVTLSAGAGLHMTDIALKLDSETTSSGLNASAAKTTVPLPVATIALNYHVTARLSWYLKTEVFALSFDDWSGTYNDAMFGIEYRIWKRLSVGAALNSNSLRLLEKDPDTRFEFQNRIDGSMLFLGGHF